MPVCLQYSEHTGCNTANRLALRPSPVRWPLRHLQHASAAPRQVPPVNRIGDAHRRCSHQASCRITCMRCLHHQWGGHCPSSLSAAGLPAWLAAHWQAACCPQDGWCTTCRYSTLAPAGAALAQQDRPESVLTAVKPPCLQQVLSASISAAQDKPQQIWPASRAVWHLQVLSQRKKTMLIRMCLQ